MLKLLRFFFVFLFSISLSAQEEVFSFVQDDGTSNKRRKEGYSFSNTKNGDLAIVFVDRKNVFANLFDKNFKKKAKATGEPLKSKYRNLLGYHIIDDNYVLLATNLSKKKYVAQIINFETGKTSNTEVDVDFGKEKFLETIQYNNELYLLTGTKDNEIVLRKFTSNLNFKEVKTFEIDYKKRGQKLLKSGFFEVGLFGGAVSNITKIDNRVPNAMEQAGKRNKLYQSSNNIYLTIESHDDLVTVLHTIDLDALTLATEVYPYTKGKEDNYKRNNSFILEDKILQMGSSRDEMTFEIKDFDNTVLKRFYIEKDEPISFKNSPIIQEGRTFVPFVNRREMEETSKYLRKITSGNLGVTAYRNNDQYAVSIGGYKVVSNGGGGMMMMPGAGTNVSVPGGTGSVFIPNYNPTYLSYYSYSSTKSTYFNTTLDKDFNYIEKEDEKNIFDRIKDLKDTFKYETAEDVFIHEGVLYFGYYNTKEKTYHLYKM